MNDNRCTRNVEGHEVKCQHRDMKTRSTTNCVILLPSSESRFTAHEHVRNVMTLCERLQPAQLVSPSAVAAVVVDACWHECSHYERLSSFRSVVLLPCCDLGCRVFGGAGGYKWQFILTAAFSSYLCLRATSSVHSEAANMLLSQRCQAVILRKPDNQRRKHVERWGMWL